MPVIMKDNVQYAYTTKGTVFHTLSNAEYEALPESEKMNGDVYCIPDREPILNPDEVWAKIGTGTLDIGDDLTDGVNQLNSSFTNFNTIQQILNTSGAFAANTPRTFTLSETYNNFLMLSIEVKQYGNPLETMIIPVSYFNTTSNGNRPILYVNVVSTQVEVYKDGANSVIVRTSNALSDAYRVSIYGVNRIV